MALSESEAKVLGVLAVLKADQSVMVREFSRAAGLSESSVRTALMRLARAGLVQCSQCGHPRWRATSRGRAAVRKPMYREWLGEKS